MKILFGMLLGIVLLQVVKGLKASYGISKPQPKQSTEPLTINRSRMPVITNTDVMLDTDYWEMKANESLERNSKKIKITSMEEVKELVEVKQQPTVTLNDETIIVSENKEFTVEYQQSEVGEDVFDFAMLLGMDLKKQSNSENIQSDDKGLNANSFTEQNNFLDNNGNTVYEHKENIILTMDDYYCESNVDAGFMRIAQFYQDEFQDFICDGTVGFKKFVVQIIGTESNLIHVSDGTARIWLDVSLFEKEFRIGDICLIESNNRNVQTICTLNKEEEILNLQEKSQYDTGLLA